MICRKKDVSTAPDWLQIQQTLAHVAQLSQQVLDCADEDTAQLSALMASREAAYASLAPFNLDEAPQSTAMEITRLLEAIREMDGQIEAKFQGIMGVLAQELGQLSKAQLAMRHYKFPEAPTSAYVENDG